MDLFPASVTSQELCQRLWQLFEGAVHSLERHRNEIATLKIELGQIRQQNSSAETKLHAYKTRYEMLVHDLIHTCNENQQIATERDRERFQKDLNQLILDQYTYVRYRCPLRLNFKKVFRAHGLQLYSAYSFRHTG
jgi:septal ring factor EnvC (AmiA/AmiB activator)